MMHNETSKIHFQPWKGPEYEKGIEGKRLLVLGESHYSDIDNPNLTQAVIKELFDYKIGIGNYQSWMKTFTVFERAMAGRELSGKESIAFWNSVVFYNFVQQMMPYQGKRPTGKQFTESAAAFEEVLNAYEPDFIIPWGTALYDHTPILDGRDTPSIVYDDAEIWTYEYTLRSGKACRMIRMNHPSIGYPWGWWHEVIARFMV